MFLKSLGLLLLQLNFLVLDESSYMIDEARDGVCGDEAIWDEWGPRGPHSLSLLSSWLAIQWQPQERHPSGWSDFLAGLKNKAGSRAFPSLAQFVMSRGHDEFQLCQGQLRPAELLRADAQTLLPQQRRAPQPLGASLYEESGLVRTQSGQLCFSSGLGENQESGELN